MSPWMDDPATVSARVFRVCFELSGLVISEQAEIWVHKVSIKYLFMNIYIYIFIFTFLYICVCTQLIKLLCLHGFAQNCLTIVAVHGKWNHLGDTSIDISLFLFQNHFVQQAVALALGSWIWYHIYLPWK